MKNKISQRHCEAYRAELRPSMGCGNLILKIKKLIINKSRLPRRA
jgi:hypothetical protein